MKTVFIGGVAGGAFAAARLRRLDKAAEIALLERAGYISSANCGLPCYVGGEFAGRSALALQTPELFHAPFRADVRTGNKTVPAGTAAKTVQVRRAADGTEYEESCCRLLLPSDRGIRQRAGFHPPEHTGYGPAPCQTVRWNFAGQNHNIERRPRDGL